MTAITLKHDEKGFLTNPNPTTGNRNHAWLQLHQISQDTRVIRQLLERYTKTGTLIIPVTEITNKRVTGGGVKAANESKQSRCSATPPAVARRKNQSSSSTARERKPKPPAQYVKVNVHVKVKLVPENVDPAKTRLKHRRINENGDSSTESIQHATTPKKRARPTKKQDRPSNKKQANAQDASATEHARDERAPVDAIPANRKAPRRGADGRFIGEGEEESRLGTAIGAFADAIGQLTVGGEEIDPTIQATKEVAGLARVVTAPLAGMGRFLFSRNQNRDNLAWYKRIWQLMRKQHLDSEKWNRQQLERLRGIEERPINSNGNSSMVLMALLGMMGLLKGLGGTIAGAIAKALSRTALGALIAKALPALIPNRPRGAGAGFGAGNRRNPPQPPDTDTSSGQNRRGNQDRNSRRRGRFLGKIPFIGSLLGLGFLASDVMGAENDDTLSRTQKNTEIGGAVGTFGGGLGGAALGAAIGTAILPGIGTAIGAAAGAFFGGEAGSIVGSKIGEWVTGLGSPEQIVNSFVAQFNQWIAELSASDVGTFLKNSWSASIQWLEDTANSVNEFFKKNLGFDPKAEAEKLNKNLSPENNHAFQLGKELGQKAKGIIRDSLTTVSNLLGITNSESEESRKTTSIPLMMNAAKNGTPHAELTNAANLAGVDPSTVLAIAQIESKLDSTARPISSDPSKNSVSQFDNVKAISSAHGYGQFLDSTWTGMLKKYGSKYGLADTENIKQNSDGSFSDESMAIANKYRMDSKIQAAMLAEYTRENIERGKELGGSDDLANAYALHNLGEGKGAKFLRALAANPSAKLTTVLDDQEIANNPALYRYGMTVAEAYGNIGKQLRNTQEVAQTTIVQPKPGLSAQTTASISDTMPDLVKQLRVKDSSGNTRTLADLGVSNYSELQAKGGQAFQGGKNSPETLYMAALTQQALGNNFDRLTAQNDRYHSEKSHKSGHTKGDKGDFTVKGISYAEANRRTRELFEKHGLRAGIDFQTINEADNPSTKATGNHIDYGLTENGKTKVRSLMAANQPIATPANKAPPALATTHANQIPFKAAANKVAPSTVSVSAIKPPDLPKSTYSSLPAISMEAPNPPKESSAKPITVNVPSPSLEPTRDVSDRDIAHIATGGISRRF